MIPVNINCQGPPLTPLPRAYEFGRALREACGAAPERIAVAGGAVGELHFYAPSPSSPSAARWRGCGWGTRPTG